MQDQNDDINERIFQMIRERQRQDAEFRRSYPLQPRQGSLSQIESPLTSDDINERMFQMMQERQRQDAEFRQRYPRGAQGPQPETGAQGPQPGLTGAQGPQPGSTGAHSYRSWS